MIRAIWGMARNDIAVWLRSPAAIAAALLPALGMGILVAVLTNSVGQQPVALVVEGQGRLTKRIAKIIRADSEAYLLTEMNAAEAERAIGEQRVAAIIVVPTDFDDAAAYGNAAIDLYLNNVDIDLADDLRRSVTRSAAEFDAPQLGLLGELHGPSENLLLPNPYRVAISERDLRETNVSFLQYQVIPIVVLIVVSAGLLGTALLTARDFERGTAKLLILSPAGHLPIVFGRLLGGTMITLGLVAPLVAVGFMARFMPPIPSWQHGAALAALLVAVTLTSVGLGALLGIAIRNDRLVTMAGLNAAVYLFFLGGGFTTVAFLPPWIQTASRALPTSYAIEGLRQALFYPDLVGFAHNLSAIAAFGVASITLAAALLARAWRRA